MKLLQVDASPRRDSVSPELTTHFVAKWKKQFPEGEIMHRDLAKAPVPLINQHWIEGAFSSPQQHTDAHRAALEFSDAVIAEAQGADVIVIGDPMHNFSVSGRLKAWLDQLVRAGKTFSYGESGPQGLLS